MRKPFLLFTLLVTAVSLVYAQQHVVDGYVAGQDGSPVPSAMGNNHQYDVNR